jgi:hypothetical protein
MKKIPLVLYQTTTMLVAWLVFSSFILLGYNIIADKRGYSAPVFSMAFDYFGFEKIAIFFNPKTEVVIDFFAFAGFSILWCWLVIRKR